jgi:hypothetical protein
MSDKMIRQMLLPKDWPGGNALDLHSGSAWFESRRGHRLS